MRLRPIPGFQSCETFENQLRNAGLLNYRNGEKINVFLEAVKFVAICNKRGNR